ncbi:amidoligase family protein [Rhodohalobacter sulfatireducens]|uniref:Amidoligase family protein n=1 Tax=Rhodohalobacter sulfatireducens TaxID=2911366 RepID=A0ABS9KHK6_9BACT|nr:amidoligase family protein [Rhodohalobacter sulfatireducens]MCG2590333.1 amidoligase family protein [Rhodohalobacter sulfatireducens]
MNQEFLKPQRATNESGEERRVGVEFEFTGVEMEDIASLLSMLYGGKIEQLSTFEFKIVKTRFGDFGLELDAQLIRDKKYEKFLRSIGIDLSEYEGQYVVEDSLKDLASSVVPYEIITPPIPLSKMGELTSLVDGLRTLKAKGTGSSFVYAFGLHLNPEIPDESTATLLNYLRAYVLLDPWIRKDISVDVSRRLTPFINRFEDDYMEHILNPDYQPNQTEFIKDYFEFGNSRNRPLDMQPLFMYLNEELTSKLVEDTLTSSRPAFHYRLPNCSLEDEAWTLAGEWNRWVLVETLAEDDESLLQYCNAYLKMRRETVIRFEAKWIELMDRWVKNV